MVRKHKNKKKSNITIAEKNPLIIYKVYPKNMSCIFNRIPIISVKFNQVEKKIDLYSFRMSIDGKVVSSEVNKYGAQYRLRKELKEGRHKVQVYFRNEYRMETYFEWYFFTNNKETKYKLYFGVPHSHTSFSSGVGTPTEAYNVCKKRGLDYLIVTDHSRRLKGKGNLDIKNNLRKTRDFDKWDLTKYEAHLMNKKHSKFLALAGFELSTEFYGHLNIFNSNDCLKTKMKSIYKLIEWLKQRENTIISINHPNENTANINYSCELDKFINLIEVGNGIPSRRYIRSEQIYYKLLDKGWHLGAINGQDNHKDDWGKEDNLTVVLAEKRNSKAFYSALANRRTYSTESRTLKLGVTANDFWMGSILNCSINDNIKFKIYAEDKKNKIRSIQIISNGGNVIKQKSDFNNKNKVIWQAEITLTESNRWYVIKVILENDKWGIASAIFC